MVGDMVTWPQVGLAAVTAVPACVAAYYGRRGSPPSRSTSHELVTGNNKTVGEMVTEIHGAASNERTQYDTHEGVRPDGR